jgi:DNA-binding protein H-NS
MIERNGEAAHETRRIRGNVHRRIVDPAPNHCFNIGKEDRLDELNRRPGGPLTEASRARPYRKVNPKFRNPERPSETWAGRGKQPHWVSELLEAGRNMDEFRIA